MDHVGAHVVLESVIIRRQIIGIMKSFETWEKLLSCHISVFS